MPSGGDGGKGGGGKVSAPQINWQNATMFKGGNLGTLLSGAQNISNYASSLIDTPLSLGNWAANLATGGAAVPGGAPETGFFNDPGNLYFGNSLYTANPSGGTYFPGIDSNPWGTGGGSSGTAGVPGSSGMPGFESAGTPGSNAGNISQISLPNFGAPADPSHPYTNQAPSQAVYYDPQTGQATTASGSPAQLTGDQQQYLSARGLLFNPATSHPGTSGSASSPGRSSSGAPTIDGQTFNPLATEWQNILAEQGVVPQIGQIEQQTNQLNQGLNQTVSDLSGAPGQLKDQMGFLQGQQDYLKQMETGQLLPGQQALIDAAVKSGQAAVNQQLGSEGLTSSTMGPELNAEVALQGAATGGQLEQGNIQNANAGVSSALGSVSAAQGNVQLLQAAQKLALGGQELSLGEQSMMFNQISQIATQAGGVQSTLYSEAMQGYGLLGQFFNQILAPMGLSMQGFTDQLNAAAQNASNQTQLDVAELQAQQSQSQMMGGLFQGLGSLFGSGSGGGLLGSLGGLIGGGGAAAGAAGIGSATAGTAVADILPALAAFAW